MNTRMPEPMRGLPAGGALCPLGSAVTNITDSIKSRASEKLDPSAGIRRLAASTTHLYGTLISGEEPSWSSCLGESSKGSGVHTPSSSAGTASCSSAGVAAVASSSLLSSSFMAGSAGDQLVPRLPCWTQGHTVCGISVMR